ncbi:hypothetical protein BYT27DRAFT_7196557, partial [Phlegmacium glaucopus]
MQDLSREQNAALIFIFYISVAIPFIFKVLKLFPSSCFPSKSLRSSDLLLFLPFQNQDTLGAGRHSTYAEANVLS